MWVRALSSCDDFRRSNPLSQVYEAGKGLLEKQRYSIFDNNCQTFVAKFLKLIPGANPPPSFSEKKLFLQRRSVVFEPVPGAQWGQWFDWPSLNSNILMASTYIQRKAMTPMGTSQNKCSLSSESLHPTLDSHSFASVWGFLCYASCVHLAIVWYVLVSESTFVVWAASADLRLWPKMGKHFANLNAGCPGPGIQCSQIIIPPNYYLKVRRMSVLKDI